MSNWDLKARPNPMLSTRKSALEKVGYEFPPWQTEGFALVTPTLPFRLETLRSLSCHQYFAPISREMGHDPSWNNLTI